MVEEKTAETTQVTEPIEPEVEYVVPRQAGAGKAIILGAVIVAIAILAAAYLSRHPGAVTFDKPYQAVLLSNGQVYYGRLEGYGTNQPVLREVYYIQVQTNPETKQQTNILLKRGKEWHSPDRMYLNPNQILLVEPVGTESKVADLIKELKNQ